MAWCATPSAGLDLLELDGVDYRPLPLAKRKARLVRLLARVQVGIALNEHTDAEGEAVFCMPARWAWRASSRNA